MEDLLEFIKLIFKSILISSILGSFIAITILLIKRVFKSKLSASWHYYVWLILILRLAVPYSYESPVSALNIFSKQINNVQVSLNASSINNTVNQNNVKNSNKVLPSNEGNVSKNSLTVPDTKLNKIRTFNLFKIASILWFVGMFTAIVFIFIFNFIDYKKIKNLEICKDEETLEMLSACKKITKIKRYIPIIYANNINGASLYGIFKPKILISERVTKKFTLEEKSHILLHELIHLRYKDICMNWVMLIIAVINWFNPVIWYCLYRMKQDCELACDEKVLKYLEPISYQNYGSTIINMAALFSKSNNSFNSTALVSSKINLKRRIGMINSFKRRTWKGSIAGAVIITVIIIVSLVNPIATVGGATRTSDKTNISQKISEYQIRTESQSATIDYNNIIQGFLKQKNLNMVVNSGAIKEIQLPVDFNAVTDGVLIGDLLNKRNELSKQNELDFSKFMGERVQMFTAGIETGEVKSNYEIVIFIADNKVVGYWVDAGMKDPKQNKPDFNVLLIL